MPHDPPSADIARMFPVAVTNTMLPDGRLLYWNGLEGSENGDLWAGESDGTPVLENSRARILDLAGGPSWTVPTLERGTTDDAYDQPSGATQDLFCADQELLHDGTLLIAGGSEWTDDGYGDDEARVFDPATNTFRSVGQMAEPRWYPSLVTLPDGRVMVTSGLRRLIASFAHPDTSFSQVRLTEIYDTATETWSAAGVSEFSLPLYPRLHLLPDGKVYFGGAGQTWGQFGETPDMLTWGQQRLYDPATQTWTTVGPTRYGIRSGATSTMLRLEPPYDQAEILLTGGTLGPSPSSGVATTISELVRVTPTGIVNEATMKGPFDGLNGDLTQLRGQRWFGTSVMLPTGEVLLLNGGDFDDVVDPGLAAGVRTPELYDPSTGTWRQLAPGGRDRVYHNTAVLLPDGRVLVGGNSPHTAHYYKHDNTLTRSNNFKDATFEIFEPPYLFRGDRPEVTAVTPADGGRALTLTLGGTTVPDDITEVVLVRLASVTHTVDADMRAVKLQHIVDGSNVTAALPNDADGRIVPPGPYYVFAMRVGDDGPVPSIARTVLVQPDGVAGGVVVTTP